MTLHGKKISLTTQIFTAMVLGSLAGLVGGKTMVQLGFIGDIWLNCIKMIVIPMVVCTIVTGIISQDNLTSLKRVSRRIITYYVITTVLACVVGLGVASILQPGHYANFAGLAAKKVTGSIDITFAGFLKDLFSTNMIATFAKGNIVQTLVISILLGIAILKMKNEEHKKTIKQVFEATNSMIFFPHQYDHAGFPHRDFLPHGQFFRQIRRRYLYQYGRTGGDLLCSLPGSCADCLRRFPACLCPYESFEIPERQC